MVSDSDRKVDTKIHLLLRHYRRGLTITEIARYLEMNRNSLSKHLERLQLTGKIECTTYGNARVFTLSHRMPIYSLLDLTTDMFFTIDEWGFLTYANDNFLSFFGLKREKTIGEPFSNIVVNTTLESIFQNIPNADDPRSIPPSDDIMIIQGGQEYYFRIKVIPTVFEDKAQGTTILMEDVTKDHDYVRSLEFLAKTSAALADFPDDEDIFQYIADRILELTPEGTVGVSSSNEATGIVKLEAIAGDRHFIGQIMEGLGLTLDNLTLNMKNFPEASYILGAGELIEGPGGDSPEGLYLQMFRCCPMNLCEEVCSLFPIGKFYVMGCTCRGGLYGNVLIRFRKGAELKNKETIEAFIRQAGVTLQRRHLREKLRKTEEEFKTLQESILHGG